MALLDVQSAARAANDLVLSAATATTGDTFENDGKTGLLVINGSGAPINVTIVTPATSDGLAITDRVIAVGAGKTALLGPWPKNVYNDGDGLVKATCSAVTTVSVAAIKV